MLGSLVLWSVAMKFLKILVVTMAASLALNVAAYEAGDVVLRAGAAMVDPQENAQPDIVGVGNNTQLGLTGSYLFTDHIGIELLASTPFKHDVKLKGGGTIASLKHLPPTISAQYYFDAGERVTPYVGAGINYLWVMESEGRNAFAGTTVDADDSVGLAFSAGMDLKLDDRLLFNAAVWHIDADTEVNINHNKPGAVRVDVDIDPWVYMIGLGYKF